MAFEASWQRLLQRVPQPAKHGVYAVKTTGIYCEFGCPSRRPKKNNTLFFATPATAEQAGFRPCKRCMPNIVKKSLSHLDRFTDAQIGDKNIR